MAISDDVRQYCLKQYVQPARERGDRFVEIRWRAPDPGLQQSLPLVCSALGSLKFEKLANVERTSIEGPLNGANTVFTFRVL
jgi:hypothetical protein